MLIDQPSKKCYGMIGNPFRMGWVILAKSNFKYFALKIVLIRHFFVILLAMSMAW
jgi:hypothetical protein